MSYIKTEWADGDQVTSAKLNKLEGGLSKMGYVPNEWKAGDVVTAEKLNNLEEGAEAASGFLDYISGAMTEFTITRDMFPHQDINDPYWDDYKQYYTEEEIEEYIASLRCLASRLHFGGCFNLTTINGLDLVTVIDGIGAFASCSKLTELSLPNLIRIGYYSSGISSWGSAIGGSSKLEKISLPKVTEIQAGTLAGSAGLKYLYLPKINKLGAAIQGNSYLEHVYLGADCTVIDAGCFGGSGGSGSGLVIDCGFAEGTVTGAPWGASNATINYNVPDPESIDAMIDGE